MLRKTKLYLDKTIKVESAESTSHTGNSSYKELSVFSRAQGKGEALGCAPWLSLHRESLPLCFLCCSSARRAESAPSLGALLSMAPAALRVISHIQELQQLGAVVGSFPMHLLTAHGGLQSASSFFLPLLLRAWFAFHFQLE